MLTLTGNYISHISKKFTDNVPNLRYIYLGENDLSTIEAGTMKQFSAAEIIDLSYNKLPEITVDLFNGMENLQHLNLEANSIKEIASGAFSTTPLLLLWLPHNCLTTVTPNMFQGTPFLKQVSLAYNNIQNIQVSFNLKSKKFFLGIQFCPFSKSSHTRLIQQQNSNSSTICNFRIRLFNRTLTRYFKRNNFNKLLENPFVCTQDGFHVMNGREAINLTTESNAICKTDYAHDVKDKCPQKIEKPPKPMCCNGVHGINYNIYQKIFRTCNYNNSIYNISPNNNHNNIGFNHRGGNNNKSRRLYN